MSNREQEIIILADQLFKSAERHNAESLWDKLTEFILPNQSGVFFTNKAVGEKKTQQLFDSTALQANHDLAAAIHSTLTNPATKWSKISFKDEALNSDKSAARWLDDTNNRIHEMINESNFDTMISKNYQFFTCLGNMVLMHEEKMNDDGDFEGFQFSSWHISQVAFAENKDGLIDTVYRVFRMTAKQVIEKWADSAPSEIKKNVHKEPYKEWEFYHCIFPRHKNEIKLNELGLSTDPTTRPFSSIYVSVETGKIVEEGGYYEFPVHVTRWSTVPGEVYGRGPGHLTLPDIRSLNKVKEFALIALHKAVTPPILVSARDQFGQLDLRPNGLTIVEDVNQLREMVPSTRLDMTQFGVEDLRNSIRNGFFIDKLMLPPRTETGEMTAFETQERLAQMQRVLGPTLSRLTSELLSPLVIRSYRILERAGALSPRPPILENRALDVDIKFTNQLSRSQSIDEINNIRAFINSAIELAQVSPSALDWIDVDGIMKHMAKVRGIPESTITADAQVLQVRQRRSAQAQQEQQLQQQVSQADILSKVGGAK